MIEFGWKSEKDTIAKKHEELRKKHILEDLLDLMIWTVEGNGGRMISQREFVDQFGLDNYRIVLSSVDGNWDILEKEIKKEYAKMSNKKFKPLSEISKTKDREFYQKLQESSQKP